MGWKCWSCIWAASVLDRLNVSNIFWNKQDKDVDWSLHGFLHFVVNGICIFTVYRVGKAPEQALPIVFSDSYGLTDVHTDSKACFTNFVNLWVCVLWEIMAFIQSNHAWKGNNWLEIACLFRTSEEECLLGSAEVDQSMVTEVLGDRQKYPNSSLKKIITWLSIFLRADKLSSRSKY